MKCPKKTKVRVAATIKGKAEGVVQDAETHQRRLDNAAQADGREGIRPGKEDLKNGRMRPAREALEAFRKKHAMARQA